MKKLLLTLIAIVSTVLFATTAFAVQVSVPSAPGAGYGLVSTSTGNYIASSTNVVTCTGTGISCSGGSYIFGSALTITGSGITLGSLSALFPLSYNAGTGVFSSLFSTTTNSGMLQGFQYVGSGGIFQTGASSTLFGYTPLNPTRQLTIAGTAQQVTSSAGAQDLSADRTWTLSLPNYVLFPNGYSAAIGSTTNATSTNLTVMTLASTTNLRASSLGSAATTNVCADTSGLLTISGCNNGTLTGITAGTNITTSGTTNITVNGLAFPFTNNGATGASSFYGQVSESTTTQAHFGGSPISLTASSTAVFVSATTTGLTTTNQWFTGLTLGGLGVDANGLVYRAATTTAGTGLTYNGAGNFSVNTSQNIATLSNLTNNGFVQTSGGVGTLGVQQFPCTVAQGCSNSTVTPSSMLLAYDNAGTTFLATSTPTAAAYYATTTTPSFFQGALLLGSGTNRYDSMFDIGSTSTSTIQLVIQNTGATGTSSADLILENNLSTNSTYYGDLGLNSSGNTDSSFAAFNKNALYLYNNDNELDLGTATTTASSTINFYTGGLGVANRRMVIDKNGNVGIGTTSPGSLLSLNSIANFTTATSSFYGNGLDLLAGCFSIRGTCVAGGGSGTVTSVATANGIQGGTFTTSGTVNLISYISTSTAETKGNLAYWTTTSGNPAQLATVATSSPTFNGGLTTSGTAGAWVGGSAYTVSIATNGVTTGMMAQLAANSILGNKTSATANVAALATSSELFTGTTGQLAFFNGTNSLFGTSSLFINTNSFIGVGSTTPWAFFSINPNTSLGTAPMFTIGSSTQGASSTLVINNQGFLGLATTSPFVQFAVATGTILNVEFKPAATSTSQQLNWNNGTQQLYQLGTAGVTFTFLNASVGQTLREVVCNPGAGTAGTLTWPAGIRWSGGTAPTQTTTANHCDAYSFLATQATSTTFGQIFYFGAATTNF